VFPCVLVNDWLVRSLIVVLRFVMFSSASSVSSIEYGFRPHGWIDICFLSCVLREVSGGFLGLVLLVPTSWNGILS
jgi:hypothetical protein